MSVGPAPIIWAANPSAPRPVNGEQVSIELTVDDLAILRRREPLPCPMPEHQHIPTLTLRVWEPPDIQVSERAGRLHLTVSLSVDEVERRLAGHDTVVKVIPANVTQAINSLVITSC